MATRHVSETVLAQKVYGGLKQAEDRGVLVDGDLTSKTAAKAAIDTDTDKMHVAEKHRINRQSKAPLDRIDNFVSGYTSGSDVSDYDQLPSNVQYPGQQVVD